MSGPSAVGGVMAEPPAVNEAGWPLCEACSVGFGEPVYHPPVWPGDGAEAP